MKGRVILGAASVAMLAISLSCGSASTEIPASTTYISTLNAANERNPANTSTATGTATYVLTGNTLSYTVVVSGLTGPATLSHIHVGPGGVSGGVIVGYVTAAVASGTVTSGTIDLTQMINVGTSSVTGDSLKVLLNNGNAYTNVHTSTFPGGEIRGQIVKQ
jgi:hypothetical protein